MKIAIDGSHLNPTHMSGTQYYLFYLLQHLARIDMKNTYILYTKNELSPTFERSIFGANPKFSYTCLPKTVSWTQISLANELMTNTPDLLISPWQTMPIFRKSSMATLGIIHDLSYKRLGFGPTFFTSTFSDHIIAVSKFTKKELMSKFWLSENKISVIYEGVDFARFKPASLGEITNVKNKYGLRKPYIFFIGYMVDRKNIPNMLSAFDLFLSESKLDVDFVLGGKIPADSNLLNFVKSLNCKKNIKFLGYVPPKDLVPLLSGAYVLSYVSKEEGFGLPILESMSCGTPVITSDNSALVEVSKDSAYLVNPSDKHSIKDSYINIFSNHSLYSHLVKKGFNRAKEFSWENTAIETLKLIEGNF